MANNKNHTKETIDAIANSVREWHKNNKHPMQDKEHTAEVKEKIGAISRGRIDTPETTEKRKQSHMMDAEREQKILKDLQDGIKSKVQIKREYKVGNSTVDRILARNKPQ